MTDPVETLVSLGFTETEARVYCELVQVGPATGYRLAKAVGKAPANTYQALAALVQRGAAAVEDGEAKTFRATAPEELLDALDRAFDARRSAASHALAALEPAAADDRIYTLKSAEQVYQRARAMIGRAREIVLFDLFPGPFERLQGALTQASDRGVRTVGVIYEASISRVDVGRGAAVKSPHAAFVTDRWPGAQLTLVVDAQEHLTALLSRDGRRVLHAVWTDSVYLSCLQHSGLSAEIRLAALRRGEADPLADISLFTAQPAGLRRLVAPKAALAAGDAA